MSKRNKKVIAQELPPVIEETEEMNTIIADDVDPSDIEDEVLEASDQDEQISSDNEDAVEISEDNDNKVRKPRGKRQILFSCAANVVLQQDDADRGLKVGDTSLVLEEVSVTMPAEGIDFDVAKGRAEAIEAFQAKYNVIPVCSARPYYIRKGITSAPRKRETINVTVAKEAEFTAERGSAIHRFKDHDWHVLVNFTKRKDTVFVFYEALVDPKQTPKDKSKPTPKFLPITALRDVQKNATA